ncbi:MAG: metalloregulator ArsR/SmtB family transcription factor [Kaiparowitsia implicata GSE-PSE-MK54-09C]|jgi:ArsR family transcriptional regulator|nr:metalloregulator ArsR/SmtB family transcription factor [Kaiparowitsia implicata GSE-PSE-MK54-09C]
MTPSPPSRPCCAPLLTDALSNEEVSRLAVLFRVLGEPTRLHLLRLIAAQPGGEVCACDLVEPLGLAQPTVSHHLKVMYDAGLVERDRRGTWIYYRIVPGAIALLRDALT